MYHYVVHFENGDFIHTNADSFVVHYPGVIVFQDNEYRNIRYETGVLKVIGTLIV